MSFCSEVSMNIALNRLQDLEIDGSKISVAKLDEKEVSEELRLER